ncbi:hypothetical protein [Oerskovia paurometabola]|uniref:hypothetical protein n=1 Tax=Oerskovia paurometabola TaxID=162170 RepID=UPI0037F90F5A
MAKPVKIKIDEKALAKAFAPIAVDRTKSEAEQIRQVSAELKRRGLKPTDAAIKKVLRGK